MLRSLAHGRLFLDGTGVLKTKPWIISFAKNAKGEIGGA